MSKVQIRWALEEQPWRRLGEVQIVIEHNGALDRLVSVQAPSRFGVDDEALEKFVRRYIERLLKPDEYELTRVQTTGIANKT